MKEFARALRKNQTDTERLMWSRLRNRQLLNCKFRRQQTIGPYIADFLCLEPKLIIELDGGQHADQQEYDELRSQYLQQMGYRVVRFWNNEVLQELDAVLEAIRLVVVNTPSPAGYPQGCGVVGQCRSNCREGRGEEN
ncbi:MAG: endonuclease domain-containing protein [Methylococcaceae bacterium]|nr:endonuclease domain-containing protein [Methylococcaceae bacterium]MDZ4156945.1 endonuclease domain-containing protein [Methylococcales bacterium]MDP2394007.1 endonuclease domain-containing protein [Methylococcaceae bacterium]MDP3018529.1 endonuclease domain-containing protein [Methylococcaceae bacterium]MDP3390945.1 endonuclease domain-containing protein [Methylococcaceae bacterium]